MDPVLIGMAAGATVGGVNNFMARRNAETSYYRQQRLMDKQNEMNVANQVNSHINNVQGLKMAGLNPALGQEGSFGPLAVSQGNADMAQTIPFNAQDALAIAQIAKTEAETKNIEKNTEATGYGIQKTMAEVDKLYAEKLKLEGETQNITNINSQYADENASMNEYGKAIAQKWQDSEWYNHLNSETRDTIDSIATGDLPLTVGGMNALMKSIGMQRELSNADRDMIRNSFDNAITDQMFSEKSVRDAMARTPKAQYDLLVKNKDHVVEDIERIKQEVTNMVTLNDKFKQEIANLKTENDYKKLLNKYQKMLNDSFSSGDLDYLKSQGEYGKWLERYSEDRLADVIRMLPAIAGGQAFANGMSKSSGNGPKIVPPSDKDIMTINGPRTFTETRDFGSPGVGQFKWH